MRWSARVSISRCTARPFTDGIRLGRRPGTALAVEGSQHKLGPLTFCTSHAATPRPMVNRALTTALPGPLSICYNPSGRRPHQRAVPLTLFLRFAYYSREVAVGSHLPRGAAGGALAR